MIEEKKEAGQGGWTAYREDLLECIGMMLVGAILFSVLIGLATASCHGIAKIQEELLAHEKIFLAVNNQAEGLALIFCGVFFMTAGSSNAQIFAERIAIPFVTFLRDGASIAVGGFLVKALQVVVEASKFDGDFCNAFSAKLQQTGGWFIAVLMGTAIIFWVKRAAKNEVVKLRYSGIFNGAVCVISGVFLIFRH